VDAAKVWDVYHEAFLLDAVDEERFLAHVASDENCKFVTRRVIQNNNIQQQQLKLRLKLKLRLDLHFQN